jgi:hypothetical protein
VRSSGAIPQPLAVSAGPGDTEGLVGQPLANAMTRENLVLGEFVDGRCLESGS